MAFHQALAQAKSPRDTVLTIGTFDGVHLGHRRLLQHLKSLAESKDLLPGVLTFQKHPRIVLNPGAKLQYISALEERLTLIRGCGIDLVIAVDFTKELSSIKAKDFVALLCDQLKMKGLVVGPDFALGHQREGNIQVLKQLGTEMDFWVEPLEAVQIGTNAIKSNSIRNLISLGDVENTASMLGRWFSLTGTVVKGDQRGRTLGFPTANLSLEPNLVIPADGIYATWVIVDGRRHQAATSIGVRPTFEIHGRTVEAFIMDFEGDLYGRSLTLEFTRRLREELAFSSVEALIDQMKLDVEQAREILSNDPVVLTADG